MNRTGAERPANSADAPSYPRDAPPQLARCPTSIARGPSSHRACAWPAGQLWRKCLSYGGPALLVSVGYMDPGNWGTDLQGGAQYRYGLLWVVALSSVMAIFLQVCSARLGVVTGKDLAQACRDFYPRWTRWPNWLACEIAIAACDLAEVLGSAVAINLLFGIPLFWCVVITAFDVMVLLALQRFGMRMIEAVISVLILTIGVCYFIEIFVLHQTQPNFFELGAGDPESHPGAGWHGLCRHRHHRGDRDAAQSVFALRPGAVAQASGRRRIDPPGDLVQHARFDGRIIARVSGQCSDPGARGDDVLWQKRRWPE